MSDERRTIEHRKERVEDNAWDRFWVGSVHRPGSTVSRPEWKQRTVQDVIERMNRDLGGRADAEYEIKE